MSVSIIDNVLWTKMSWELSFEKTIHLDKILPQIGVVYPLVFDGDNAPPSIGKSSVLWKPPHSELNGWSDMRPSEIINSFVLQGELRYSTESTTEFEFLVTGKESLFELIEQASEEQVSPLARYTLPDGRSLLYWENADHVLQSPIGKYTYLSASGDDGVQLELILSSNDYATRINYSSVWHEYFTEQALITNYILQPGELVLFEKLLDMADVVIDDSIDDLPNNQIYGAEYC